MSYSLRTVHHPVCSAWLACCFLPSFHLSFELQYQSYSSMLALVGLCYVTDGNDDRPVFCILDNLLQHWSKSVPVCTHMKFRQKTSLHWNTRGIRRRVSALQTFNEGASLLLLLCPLHWLTKSLLTLLQSPRQVAEFFCPTNESHLPAKNSNWQDSLYHSNRCCFMITKLLACHAVICCQYDSLHLRVNRQYRKW